MNNRVTVAKAILVLLISGTAQNCKHAAQSATKHDLGSPVRAKGMWAWRSVPENKQAPMLPSPALPANHPLTVRIQFWLDKIDAELRKKHADDFVHIPKPRAVVLDSSEYNAFATAAPVCFSRPLRLQQGGSGVEERVDVRVGNGAIAETEPKCGSHGVDDHSEAAVVDEIVTSFVADFNAAGQACQFSVDPDGTLVAGSGCTISEALKKRGFGRAKSVTLYQMVDFLSITARMFADLPEDQVVSLIAHELGHYYRAHALAPDNAYAYFYSLSEKEAAEKPRRDEKLQSIGAEAFAAAQWVEAAAHFQPNPSLKVPPYLYDLELGLLGSVSDEGHVAECKTARLIFQDEAYRAKIGSYPHLDGPLASEALAALKKSEAAVLACLAKIPLVETDAAVKAGKPGTSSWESSVHQAMDSLRQNLFGDSAKALTQGAVMAVVSTQARGTKFPAGATTVADALDAIIVAMRDNDKRATALASQDQHFGYYTTEQEADDLSAEFLAMSGINPAAMGDVNLSMAALTSPLPSQSTDCAALRRNAWLDADHKYVFVDLGPILDPHHSFCYRAFNISREIAAHKLKAAKVPSPLLPDSEWAVLKKKADDIVAPSLAFFGKPENKAEKAKFFKSMNCAFDHR